MLPNIFIIVTFIELPIVSRKIIPVMSRDMNMGNPKKINIKRTTKINSVVSISYPPPSFS